MLSYRPNVTGLVGRSIVVCAFLLLFGFLLWVCSNSRIPWAALPVLFLLPIAYCYIIPLVIWPISVAFDSIEQQLVLGYLVLPNQVIPRDQIKACNVSKVRHRDLYHAYILVLRSSRTIILSDLNIARFPGRLAHDMRLSEMEELPTFFPGFRRLMHRSK